MAGAGIEELFQEVEPFIFGFLTARRRQAVARFTAPNPTGCHSVPLTGL